MNTETPINEKPYPEGHKYITEATGIRVLDDSGYGEVEVWNLNTERPVVLGKQFCMVPLIRKGQTSATPVSPREALWVSKTFNMRLVAVDYA